MFVCWRVTVFSLGKQSNRLLCHTVYGSGFGQDDNLFFFGVKTDFYISPCSSFLLKILNPVIKTKTNKAMIYPDPATHTDVRTSAPRPISFPSLHPSRNGSTEPCCDGPSPDLKPRSDGSRSSRLFFQPTLWGQHARLVPVSTRDGR